MLTYGEIINFINKEALILCNDLKLKATLKTEKSQSCNELGSFCEQYGFEKIIPPSSKSKKLFQNKKFSKRKHFKHFPEVSNKKKFSKGKPFSKRKFSKNTSNITCWKCNKNGHYSNKCPLKKKISTLQIDEETKNQLLNLIESSSDNESNSELE